MRTAKSPRSTLEDWLEEGLAMLREHGDRGLTIDAMCRRMGRTKGSFYHHFSNRKDFVGKLLEYWERTFTRRVIRELEPLGNPRRRLRALAERTVRDVDSPLERTIRLWAERDPDAKAALSRVDRAREDFLHEQFEKALGDPRRGRVAARAHLALLVGTQMLYHDLTRHELAEVYGFLDRLGLEAETGRRPPPPAKETP